jgi:hypothetical protein
MSAPEFNLVLPSNKKDLNYRPYTVKEQKALLIAKESDNKKEIINATENIVQNCTDLSAEEVKKLPYFDLEWIFLHVRAKSVGEEFNFVMSHGPDHECKATSDVSFKLEDIKFELDKEQSTKVQITDDIGIEFRYPTFEELSEFSDIENPMVMYNFIVNNMKMVFDKERVYDDFTKEEAETFIDSLKTDQYTQILKWFNRIPVLSHEFEWECQACKQKSKMTLNGLNDFFL